MGLAQRLTEGLRTVIRFCRHYARDIAIALALAVLAAVIVEQYERWSRLQAMQNNRKAVATLEGFDRSGREVGQGTGVFVKSNGVMVTAYHVVKGAADVQAHLASGAIYLLKSVLEADEKADVAVLQFRATDTPSVKGLGDSDKLQIGDEVYAIGTSAGLEGTVSTGDISNPNFIQFFRCPLAQVEGRRKNCCVLDPR